jgi:hypothetical protein
MRVALWVAGALGPLVWSMLVARAPWLADVGAAVGGGLGIAMLTGMAAVLVEARAAHAHVSGLSALLTHELGQEAADTGRDAIVQALAVGPVTVAIVAVGLGVLLLCRPRGSHAGGD